MRLRHIIYTPELFQLALERSQDEMERIMAEHEGVRGYLMALPPCVPEPKYMDHAGFDSLVEQVGFEYDFGGCSDEHPYHRVAPAKLLSVYLWQLSSREVRDQRLLLEGMSKWAGGIIFMGIPVAYSGQPEEVDEEISEEFARAAYELGQDHDLEADPGFYPVSRQKDSDEAGDPAAPEPVSAR